mmetsp:Transcript_58113/g.168690  ORF Transcript_58113/g.168690 Transcript_58113/m.168690 type:complete len:108 (+) Transcript_58113:290-613(+)
MLLNEVDLVAGGAGVTPRLVVTLGKSKDVTSTTPSPRASDAAAAEANRLRLPTAGAPETRGKFGEGVSADRRPREEGADLIAADREYAPRSPEAAACPSSSSDAKKI